MSNDRALISAAKVQETATLARISISAEECGKIQENLDKILHLFDELARVDTAGIDLMDPVTLTPADCREDEVTEPDGSAALAGLTPYYEPESGLIAVPIVIE